MPLNAPELGLGTVAVHQDITPEVRKRLDAETDARFAAQTGITRKLDPHSFLDQIWIPVWKDLYQKVMLSYVDGTLAWTHDHPSIGDLLGKASLAAGDAAAHLASSLTPTGAFAGSQAAAAAHAAATDATRRAGLAQALIEAANAGALGALRPAIVSPPLVQDAVAKTHEAALQGAPLHAPADVVTALQAANAAARANEVHQVATGSAGSPPAPQGPTHAASRTMKIAIGATAGLGAIALVALATKSRGGGKRGKRRRSGAATLNIRAVR